MRHRAQHQENEEEAGRVEAGDQLAKREQAGHAVRADGEGHRAEGAGRRCFHHDADDAEQNLRGKVDHRDERPAALAEKREREGEQHREEQHLQDLAFSEGPDDRRGNDVHHELGHALLPGLRRIALNRGRVDRAGIDVHAGAGPPNVDEEEPDDQCQRCNDFEVDECFDRDPADPFQVFHPHDPVHDRAEDDRRDQHPDDFDEGVAQRLHAHGKPRIEVAEQDAGENRGPDLEVQVPVESHGVIYPANTIPSSISVAVEDARQGTTRSCRLAPPSRSAG